MNAAEINREIAINLNAFQAELIGIESYAEFYRIVERAVDATVATLVKYPDNTAALFTLMNILKGYLSARATLPDDTLVLTLRNRMLEVMHAAHSFAARQTERTL